MADGSRPKVFVVHGRDLLACDSIARLLRDLELEPVFLDDSVLPGQTWLECIDARAREVEAAVVIYRGDDVGALVSERAHLRLRARQNVLFELGFMIAKLGRTKVCVLHEDGVEIPTDYEGARVVALGRSWGWKVHLAFSLRDMGFNVDPVRLINSGVGKPSDQIIFRDSAQRTRKVIDELTALAGARDGGKVRFSGFLSILAVSEQEMQEREDGALLKAERDILLRLAREGNEVYCIVTPPTEVSGHDRRTAVARSRLMTLLQFLRGNDSALAHIYWAVAPRIENYVYVIGQRSFFQGFRGDDPNRGFSLTELRTAREELMRQSIIYDERFQSHENDTLMRHGLNRTGDRIQDLRLATIHALESVMQLAVGTDAP